MKIYSKYSVYRTATTGNPEASKHCKGFLLTFCYKKPKNFAQVTANTQYEPVSIKKGLSRLFLKVFPRKLNETCAAYQNQKWCIRINF